MGSFYSPLSCCARFSSNPGSSTFETSFLRFTWERYASAGVTSVALKGRLAMDILGNASNLLHRTVLSKDGGIWK